MQAKRRTHLRANMSFGFKDGLIDIFSKTGLQGFAFE